MCVLFPRFISVFLCISFSPGTPSLLIVFQNGRLFSPSNIVFSMAEYFFCILWFPTGEL